MGATRKPREYDIDQPSHTEELSNWILRVRSKKINCRRNRRRNLRMEAVLTYTLSKAERELRNKQMLRFKRWQQVKDKLTISQRHCQNEEEFSESSYDEREGNVWEAPLCSELSSLDSFMLMLKEIKAPLQR
ncbi:uncharacterized protein LOC124414192 [Diprion similis]|uniref:uncharacterized protein LOC124414178 n=1 Tax=Diprion similis TaxID=362088 RepID=UPI001EF8B9F0|nr:uncharacterized protein LOC124414178 [Diprion similis]XP_046751121.1 uncharacterized protein LOC124414192 [Diprion similis]